VLSEGKAAGIVTAEGSYQLALEERSMVATKSRPPEGRTDFEIQVEGRVYPVALRGGQRGPARIAERGGMLPLTDGAASTRRSKKQAKPAVREKTVAEEILSRVWEPLPLAGKSVDDFAAVDEIVRCFVKSHERLSEMAGEARRLLETVCHAHVCGVRSDQIASKRQEEAEEAKIRECMDVTMPAVWLGPELDASTVVQEPAVVMAKLTQSLARSACKLVESFFSALEQLVDKEVVGLIQWHSDSVCKFHFFRRLLVHEFDGRTTKEQTATFWRSVDGREVERTEKTTATTTKGRHVHEHIRHEQQLMNAANRPLGSSDLVIPEDVQQILDVVPHWLSPFVGVAVGECFRERIIRHTEKSEQWEDSQITKQVIERPVTYFDPAVTIGEFVLAGWGQREHAAEIERRAAAKKAERSRGKASDAAWLAALLFGVGSLLVLLSLVFAAKLVWPSVIVCLLALWPLNMAVVHNARQQSARAGFENYLLVNMSAILLILAVLTAMLAVVSKELLPAGMAVVFFIFFVPMCLSTVRGLRSQASSSTKQRK
jgi:hypothetical protein